MDKSLKYGQIVAELMQEYAEYWGTSDGVSHQAIVDREHQNYTLITLGWQTNKHRYIHSISFHIQILNGKVWVHQNETEEMIADELIEKGVAREDIVLGFLPERDRAYSGFAVA